MRGVLKWTHRTVIVTLMLCTLAVLILWPLSFQAPARRWGPWAAWGSIVGMQEALLRLGMPPGWVPPSEKGMCISWVDGGGERQLWGRAEEGRLVLALFSKGPSANQPRLQEERVFRVFNVLWYTRRPFSWQSIQDPQSQGPWRKVSTPATERYLTMRIWSLVALLGAYPAVWLVSRGRKLTRRWVRRRAGRCLYCGYDLTGNVSGICPECGEKV